MMTVSQTNRLSVFRWSDDSDPFTRTQMTITHDNLELLVAKFESGSSLPAMPNVSYERSLFYNTSDSELYFSPDGSSWIQMITNIDAVTLNGTETLTNKTLTSPQISSISNGGTVTLPSGNHTLVARTTTDTLTNKTLTSPTINGGTANNVALVSPSVSSVVNGGTVTFPSTSDTLVGRTTSDTLSNKTLTSPNVNDGLLKSPLEKWNIVSASPGSGVNIDVITSAAWHYTSDTTANFYVNVRGNSSTTLSSLLDTGESISIVVAVKNGSTGRYVTSFRIDGTTISPEWAGGGSPTEGNANSDDIYLFTILKTGSSAYRVWAQQVQFA